MFRLVIISALVALAIGAAVKDDHRIVNGYQIDISRRPHQAAFLYRGGHFCGGTLIARNIVVTAAHCTNKFDGVEDLSIRVGSSSKYEGAGGQTVRVAKMIQHEDFDSRLNNDIALLLLEEPVELGPEVNVAPLRPSPPEHDELLYVSGWGLLSDHGDSPEWLQEVAIRAIDNKICEEHLGELGPSMICAGFMDGSADACQGDSGGPLVDEKNQLVGVVSWGLGCAEENHPGIYTSIPAMLEWIRPYWVEYAQ